MTFALCTYVNVYTYTHPLPMPNFLPGILDVRICTAFMYLPVYAPEYIHVCMYYVCLPTMNTKFLKAEAQFF